MVKTGKRKHKTAIRGSGSVGARRATGLPAIGYLLVTGGVLASALLVPDIGSTAIAESFARLVGGIFPVVENARRCSTGSPERAVFIAVLVVGVHVMMLGTILPDAWRNRHRDDAEPMERPAWRDWVSVPAQFIFVVLIYWYTFFEMGQPAPGTPSAASYVCWNLWTMWLLFTAQGILSVGLACILVVVARTFAVRLAKRTFN